MNDSHAGLLGGMDNTGFNSTGFDNIGFEEGDEDFDTSYENDDTDNRDLLDDPIDDREDILVNNEEANPNISGDFLLKSFGEEVLFLLISKSKSTITMKNNFININMLVPPSNVIPTLKC